MERENFYSVKAFGGRARALEAALGEVYALGQLGTCRASVREVWGGWNGEYLQGYEVVEQCSTTPEDVARLIGAQA